jgi:hypothetical protein
MIEVGCILKGRVIPIQVLHPLVDQRVPVSDGAIVAFEVTVVDWIETDYGRVQANVRFGELVSDQEVFLVNSYKCMSQS